MDEWKEVDIRHMLNNPDPKARYVYSVIGIAFPPPYSDQVIAMGIIAGSDESNDWRSKLIASKRNGYNGHDMTGEFSRKGEERLRQLHLDPGHPILRYSYPMPIDADGAQTAIDKLWPTVIDEAIEEEAQRLFG